jgi:hypothetical protein
MKPLLALFAGIACLGLALSSAAHACEVRSGAGTAALVELYTSEGCSSCPPADAALSRLRTGKDVIPLALHVTYWDNIGRKDAFAQKAFDVRQAMLAAKEKAVYTPQFFVNGAPLGHRPRDLAAAIRDAQRAPAQAQVTLNWTGQGDRVSLEARASAKGEHAALYLAVSESGLETRVLRGENGGATLRHDDTVRVLYGPVPLAHGLALLRTQLRIPAEWRARQLNAVAFVQDAGTGAVLQAVSTAACNAS